jgi:calcineurin-like phosphoesterase family protein
MKLTPHFFVIADLHFGHQNLVNWGKRGEDHNERIIEEWNSVVGKQDSVLVLGDLTMCGKEQTMKFVKQLRGKKYLIRGNHDGNSDGWYRDCGFEVVEPIYKRMKDKYGEIYHVLYTHEPVSPLPYLGMNGQEWFNIHGHLHGDSHRGDIVTTAHYDVGYDVIHTPKRIYEIINLLRSK